VPNSNKTEDVDFYNPHDTLKREEGVYLDYQERVHAEEQRAVREDRKPDFDNMPASTGTPLVTRAELPARPLAVGVEVFSTLPVATESPDPADEDQVKAAAKAQAGVANQVNEGRLARIKQEAEAAKAAADNRLKTAEGELNQAAARSTTTPRATPSDVARKAQARKTATKSTAKKVTTSKRAASATAKKRG
jgi:hypothetical protein